MSAFKNIFATITFHHDPLIGKMEILAVHADTFRKDMARLIEAKKAFILVPCGSLHVTLHPTDELMDSYYKAMGAT